MLLNIGVFLLFFGIPILAVLFFPVSLYRYCAAKRKNNQLPGSFSPAELHKRKLLLLVSAVLAGVLVAVIIVMMALLLMSIAFM